MSSDEHNHRRYWIWFVIAAVIVLGAVGYFHTQESGSEEKEKRDLNIIFISLDNVRTNTKMYGYHRDTMPKLDSMAKKGILFENAVVNVTWTLPSHMTMLTGLYPSSHGVDDRGTKLDPDAITLAEWLKLYDFSTRAIVSRSFIAPAFGYDQGFDNFTSVNTPYAPQVNKLALEYMKDFASKESPGKFFLFLHYLDAHTPFEPPDPYDTMYDPDYKGTITGEGKWVAHYTPKNRQMDERDLFHMVALYDGCMSYIDGKLAELFDGIDKLGLWENTILIVTSDHGEEFKEHGSMDHGMALYDEQLRVPLIFYNPKYLARGVRVPNQVSMIDLFPTITDLLGIEHCDQVQGKSFYPYLTGDLRYNHTETTFIETKDRNHFIQGIRSNDWKYLNLKYLNERELYHLSKDPKELKNVIDKHPDIADKYQKEIDHWINVAQEITFKPQKSSIDKDLMEQLTALGYVDGKGEKYKGEADSWNLFKKDKGEYQGQINEPRGITFDPTGNLYIADFRNYRIQKFSPAFEFLTSWGSEGTQHGQFKDPCGLCVDSEGNVIIADTWNSRCQKFSGDGNFLKQYPGLSTPRDVCIHPSGDLIISNSGSHNIMRVLPEGKLRLKFGKKGDKQGEFDRPCGVAADPQGNIYVADALNRRIQKFDGKGNFLAEWPFTGTPVDKYAEPYIALDKHNNLYLADSQMHQIKKYDPEGKLVSTLGAKGSGDFEFRFPTGITIAPDGTIYVSDTWNHRLVKLDPDKFK